MRPLAGSLAVALAAFLACSSPGASSPSAEVKAEPKPEVVDLAPSAFRRLSRDELVTSFQALLGAAPARADLPEDPRSGHQPLRTAGVPFIQTELAKLQQTILAFASEQAPIMLARSGCTQTGQAQRDCLRSWSRSLAEQVLRRPERPEEAAKYASILSTANGTPEADTLAVKWLLGALFFAPSFLYRTEIGTPGASDPSRRVLTAPELATKLSYLSTLGPPDSALLASAARGDLADGAVRISEFDRLRSTPNGKRALSVMLHEWLGANESKIALKSPTYLKGLAPTFADDIRHQADTFIDSILSGPEPTVPNLLTSKSYLADPILSQITGPSMDTGVSTGDTPQYERIGLLMHPQILSAHTKENGASPFQIGLFIKAALLCEKVSPPPDGATALARTDVPSGLSMRESLEYRTSAQPVCSTCHAEFAPLGFAFMAFDPMGRFVTQDPSGKPWDLAGNIKTAEGDELTFGSPAELAQNLAANPKVQQCFGQTALEWSLGRALSPNDGSQLAALAGAFANSGGNVIEILRSIIATPEFVQAELAPAEAP